MKKIFTVLLCVLLAFGTLTACNKENNVITPDNNTETQTPSDIPEEKPGETPEEKPEEKPGETPEEKPEEKPGETPSETPDDNAPTEFTDIGEVKITDAYAVNAMSKEIAYLKKLDSDKLLYYFYVNAELTPKAASSYSGGWEGGLIGGHILGHYLSALAQAYSNANTSVADKAVMLQKIEYIVSELRVCQNNAVAAGSQKGFIWGASLTATGKTNNYEYQFDFVERTGNGFSSDSWVPWYTMHKIIAGLYDCVTLAQSEIALTVLTDLGDWVYNRVSKWTQSVKTTVLKAEYGGMNDCMYSLYALTGEEKYAVAASMFDEETLFDRILSAPADYLDGLHANTTIPKVLGALNRYVSYDREQTRYLQTAVAFWDYVTEHHTYITGGNSEWEHFGADDILNGERTNCNCETCNTYNMLKLSRTLFILTGDKKYLDYYENTYYNAILSSQNPETGMTTYFQPMATGYYKVYSTEETNFWCCTGSGMESFTKLGDSIYYRAGKKVYVSLYLDSVYETEDFKLVQSADLENSDEITVSAERGDITLMLRVPSWSASFDVKVNNESVSPKIEKGFASVDVSAGDRVIVTLKKTVTAHNLPDGENVYAFKYGPFVLSAELGTQDMEAGVTGVNVTIPASNAGIIQTITVSEGTLSDFIAHIGEHLVRGNDGKFVLTGAEEQIAYSYHFRQYTQRYGLYFVFYADDFPKADEPERTRVWNTLDTVQPGYGQYENDSLHSLQENDTVAETGVSGGIGTYRAANAGGSFTYRMKADRTKTMRLQITLSKADNGKSLLVKAGNTTLYAATLDYQGVYALYNVEITVPAAAFDAAQNITYTDEGGATQHETVIPVTFSGVDGAASARVCSYIRMQVLERNPLVDVDSDVMYFVDCGDYDPETLSAGEKLGVYNSATEQVYGADAVTGKKWGIVDTHAVNLGAGADPAKGVSTNSTWAFEYLAGDGASKTDSNRYTKNQFESGVSRNLHYKFELDDGSYTVKMYFSDPWACSKNPCVSANGEAKITNGEVNKELTFTVTVTGGELTLDITSTDLCINLCYIVITR